MGNNEGLTLANYDFDVAVSFAGEDRAYVEAVVDEVKRAGFSIFYDEDDDTDLWGEELTEFFANVYENRSRYAVMFISRHYAAKPWTNAERRSILIRALEQTTPYLLPVRIDSTTLPGVRSSIGYLDAASKSPSDIATAIQKKLGAPKSSGDRQFNGRVPRTERENSILLGERPPAWEYLLFSYLLTSKMEPLEGLYRDHRAAFALPSKFASDDGIEELVHRELAHVLATTSAFEELLLGDSQTVAMGLPGEQGDPDHIDHLAASLISIYSDLLEWSRNIRSYATEGDEARSVLRTLAKYADQPIEEMRRFVDAYRSDMDGMSARLQAGENVDMQMPIKFEVPEGLSDAFSAAVAAFGQR